MDLDCDLKSSNFSLDEYIRKSFSKETRRRRRLSQPRVSTGGVDSLSSGSETDESEDKNEIKDERKSLRQSLASQMGVDASTRLVNKFGSVKAVMNENERLSRAGLFVIHPYSNFRFEYLLPVH